MYEVLGYSVLGLAFCAAWRLFHGPKTKGRIVLVAAAVVALVLFLSFGARVEGNIAKAHVGDGAHCTTTATASNPSYGFAAKGVINCPKNHNRLGLVLNMFRCKTQACPPNERADFYPPYKTGFKNDSNTFTMNKLEDWPNKGLCKFGVWVEGSAFHSNVRNTHRDIDVDFTTNVWGPHCG